MVSPVQLALLPLNLILSAAPENGTQVNFPLLSDIINCTSEYHQFEFIPVIAGQGTILEVEDFIIGLQRPTYILSEMRPNTSPRLNSFQETLVLFFFRRASEGIFQMIDTFTWGRRLAPVIFVPMHPITSHREVHSVMLHAWRNNYMRALLLYCDNQGRDHLVSYDVYDHFRVYSVIEDYRWKDILPMRPFGNMNHHEIRTPIKSDLPRVFRVKDAKGRTQLKGYSYQLFSAYAKYMNATLEEYQMPVHVKSINPIMKDIHQLISDGVIEISLHPYDLFGVSGIQSSYPIWFNSICAMIPMVHEIPSYMYIWRPFRLDVWLLVLFATISLAVVLTWIPAKSGNMRQEFGLSLLTSVGHMLNVSAGEYKQNVTWSYFLVHKACWVLGLLVTEWYRALLHSFWTTTVYGHQIDSMDEFLESDLKILMREEDFEEFTRFPHLPVEFKNRLVPTDVDSLFKYRTDFNTTSAYFISTDRWQFLNLQQQFSQRPIFRLSNICVVRHYITLQMTYDSRLQYSLKLFILFAHQSGLLNYWLHSDFRYASKEGYVKLMTETYEVEPLQYENLLLAFWVFQFCLAISVFVFLIELVSALLPRYWKRTTAQRIF